VQTRREGATEARELGGREREKTKRAGRDFANLLVLRPRCLLLSNAPPRPPALAPHSIPASSPVRRPVWWRFRGRSGGSSEVSRGIVHLRAVVVGRVCGDFI
jgi:hypothetical protein